MKHTGEDLAVDQRSAEGDHSEKPGTMSPDWYIRQQLVLATDDQREIAKVARTDPDSHVRIVALLMLQDRTLIEEIGRIDRDETVRAVAALCSVNLGSR